MKQMKLPRWAHRIYAYLFSYSWQICPLCGESFGGHEKQYDLMFSGPVSVSVCGNCELEAVSMNSQLLSVGPFPDICVDIDSHGNIKHHWIKARHHLSPPRAGG